MVDPSFLKADLGWSSIKRPEAHKRVDLDTYKLVRSDLLWTLPMISQLLPIIIRQDGSFHQKILSMQQKMAHAT